MTPEQWQQVKTVLAAALERAPEERQAYLDGVCAEPSLRREVESLIAADEQGDSGFLERAAVEGGVLKSGTQLGPYEILAPLGRGGMGEVYRARDTRLGRMVAIKVLPAIFADDGERMARFGREARVLASLNHPNIASIYGLEESNGTRALVMELVEGPTLAERIAQGPIPLEEALPIAGQIAEALEYAHERGVIHRDLKPANIKLTQEGKVKVLDFGLAKALEDSPAAVDLSTSPTPSTFATKASFLLGTAAYMSPEQAKGKSVDHHADIWAFGVMLYEMLSGRQLYYGETASEILAAVIMKEPSFEALPAGTPRSVLQLLRRCLAKDPRQRLQAIGEARILIGEYLANSAAAVQRAVPRQRRWLWAGAGVAVVMILGGAVWFRFAHTKLDAPVPRSMTVPLTGNLGQEYQPAFSPDGQQLAFAWDGGKGGNFNIYVKLVGSGAPLRLTSGSSDDFSPTWSPDGRYIAFYRRSPARLEIFAIPALGGPERRLDETPIGLAGQNWYLKLAWSPNGEFLAVAGPSSPQDTGSGIFLLSTESGERRRLTSPPQQSLGDGFPAFSPDGQILAFSRSSTGGVEDVYLQPITVDGTPNGEPKRLSFDQRGIFGLDWTADGRGIVFSSNRSGGYSLWRIPTSGGQIEPVVQNAVWPSISRREHRLAYTRQFADTNIWRTEGPLSTIKLPRQKTSSPFKLIASKLANRAPQFSPDGKRIVFQSGRSGSYEIWVCDSEGLNAMQLTSFGGPLTGTPRWSADGRRISFDSTKEGHTNIYAISAEGGMPHRLTAGTSENVRPSWSQDGRWIYFGSNRSGTWQVWKVPTEGGTAVQVTRNGGREAFESPDGKFVYYSKYGVPGIWRILVSGAGEENQVLDRGLQGHWAVLERGICLLNTTATPLPTIDFFDFATGRLEKIRTLSREVIPPRGFTFPAFTVSRDGRWILYVQADYTESEIMLVENFH